jgi:hypothetical protein
MIIIFPMLPPSTHRMLLQTKSAGLESFVVSWQARNQFSEPSTEMELIQWPRAARSTTSEQDRRPASKIDVCVWFCISHHEDMAALQPCSDVSMMTVICACVILHISPWRYGRIVTLFWCINDDCNLCVCDFASQETCFCDYLCAVQFFVWFTYPLAKLVIISTVWQINLFLSGFLM